jgi:hypothetical protein
MVIAEAAQPAVKTQDGVLVPSNAGRLARFHDPDGNVLGLFERVEGGRHG